MPTVITVESQQSPTESSSRSNSFTDEGSSTGTGVLVSPQSESQEDSDLLDDQSWDPVYPLDEIDPSDSASRPRTSQQYRRPESRAPPSRRGPTRRHTTAERTQQSVHRHPAPNPPSSVAASDNYPAYGRGGYPHHAGYGPRQPQPGYAESFVSAPAYTGGNPFGGNAGGQMMPYGAAGAGGYGYPSNPFAPAPGLGGAGPGFGYPPHHAPGHGIPPYVGHDMMSYGQAPGFGYGPYGPGGGQMPFYPHYPAQSPPSDSKEKDSPGADPEVEKKLAGLEKMLQEAKLENERKDKAAAEKEAAEKRAKEDASFKAEAKKKFDEEVAKIKDEEGQKTKVAEEAKKKAEDEAKALSKPKEEKKKPIKFKDAVGRKFSFPFHLCSKWAGMEDLIRQAFLHVEVIGPHVADGHYDLVGPNGEIILPQVWETMIEPDWAITMHMWPMPEPPKSTDPPEGIQVIGGDPRRHSRVPGRPGGRVRTDRSGPPGGRNRGPPPPPSWIGPPPRPPGGGSDIADEIVMIEDYGAGPKSSKKKSKESSGGMLGGLFGGGKPKSSGKGRSRK